MVHKKEEEVQRNLGDVHKPQKAQEEEKMWSQIVGVIVEDEDQLVLTGHQIQ